MKHLERAFDKDAMVTHNEYIIWYLPTSLQILKPITGREMIVEQKGLIVLAILLFLL